MRLVINTIKACLILATHHYSTYRVQMSKLFLCLCLLLSVLYFEWKPGFKITMILMKDASFIWNSVQCTCEWVMVGLPGNGWRKNWKDLQSSRKIEPTTSVSSVARCSNHWAPWTPGELYIVLMSSCVRLLLRAFSFNLINIKDRMAMNSPVREWCRWWLLGNGWRKSE